MHTPLLLTDGLLPAGRVVPVGFGLHCPLNHPSSSSKRGKHQTFEFRTHIRKVSCTHKIPSFPHLSGNLKMDSFFSEVNCTVYIHVCTYTMYIIPYYLLIGLAIIK